MIHANITTTAYETYVGSDDYIIEYYCDYIVTDDDSTNNPLRFYNLFGEPQLLLEKTYDESDGNSSIRFNSIDDINKLLFKRFPNEDIFTYKNDKIFKQSICRKNGEDFGYKIFGEQWDSVPKRCDKALIDENPIIKCFDCGRIYQLDEVTIDRPWKNIILTKFIMPHWSENPCKCFNLIWNVVL